MGISGFGALRDKAADGCTHRGKTRIYPQRKPVLLSGRGKGLSPVYTAVRLLEGFKVDFSAAGFNKLLLLEEERDAPNSADAHKHIDYAADYSRLSAE